MVGSLLGGGHRLLAWARGQDRRGEAGRGILVPGSGTLSEAVSLSGSRTASACRGRNRAGRTAVHLPPGRYHRPMLGILRPCVSLLRQSLSGVGGGAPPPPTKKTPPPRGGVVFF